MDETGSSFSLRRTLYVAVPVAVATAIGMQMWGDSLQSSATTAMQKNVLSTMLPKLKPNAGSAFTFTDANGDLVADSPSDPTKLQSPEELVFAYIASETEEGEAPDMSGWRELLDTISQATGKPVSTVHYQKVREQLQALRDGHVHLIGLSTGAAPLAVETAGFVPLCSMADSEGNVGYKMVLLTSAKSKLNSPADSAGGRVIFVRPTSNSGFKAALVQLYEEANLLPERDYDWSFSLSHEQSVRAVIDGHADAAPVASDILAKMIEQGEIEQSDYRVLYESEAFPPAVIGCAHDLPRDLVVSLRESLLGFDWTGTGLVEVLGPMGVAKFEPVNYKDDWANIRRIDAMVEALAKQK